MTEAPGGCMCWNCRFERPLLVEQLRRCRSTLHVVSALAVGVRLYGRRRRSDLGLIADVADARAGEITRALDPRALPTTPEGGDR